MLGLDGSALENLNAQLEGQTRGRECTEISVLKNFFFTHINILSALSTIAMILYHHQIRISPQKKRNSVVITQTTIMVSYIIFWCIPTIIYLIAVILGYEEVIFGRITLVLASGSGFFASLNPFFFLWKHTEFRTLFLCFYCRKKSAKHASVSVAQNAQNTKKSTITRKANDTIIQSLTPP